MGSSSSHSDFTANFDYKTKPNDDQSGEMTSSESGLHDKINEQSTTGTSTTGTFTTATSTTATSTTGTSTTQNISQITGEIFRQFQELDYYSNAIYEEKWEKACKILNDNPDRMVNFIRLSKQLYVKESETLVQTVKKMKEESRTLLASTRHQQLNALVDSRTESDATCNRTQAETETNDSSSSKKSASTERSSTKLTLAQVVQMKRQKDKLQTDKKVASKSKWALVPEEIQTNKTGLLGPNASDELMNEWRIKPR